MKGNIEERACDLAVYIIENRTTVRAAASLKLFPLNFVK